MTGAYASQAACCCQIGWFSAIFWSLFTVCFNWVFGWKAYEIWHTFERRYNTVLRMNALLNAVIQRWEWTRSQLRSSSGNTVRSVHVRPKYERVHERSFIERVQVHHWEWHMVSWNNRCVSNSRVLRGWTSFQVSEDTVQLFGKVIHLSIDWGLKVFLTAGQFPHPQVDCAQLLLMLVWSCSLSSQSYLHCLWIRWVHILVSSYCYEPRYRTQDPKAGFGDRCPNIECSLITN